MLILRSVAIWAIEESISHEYFLIIYQAYSVKYMFLNSWMLKMIDVFPGWWMCMTRRSPGKKNRLEFPCLLSSTGWIWRPKNGLYSLRYTWNHYVPCILKGNRTQDPLFTRQLFHGRLPLNITIFGSDNLIISVLVLVNNSWIDIIMLW